MQIHQYETYSHVRRSHHLDKVYSIRLLDSDINILNAYYPGESISFQVRSLADLKGSDNDFGPNCLGNLAAYREIADLQKYYAIGGDQL